MRDQVEENQVTCPVCKESFMDMRGLTSHARHVHELDSDEVAESLDSLGNRINIHNPVWKIIGGAGAVCLAVLAAFKFR